MMTKPRATSAYGAERDARRRSSCRNSVTVALTRYIASISVAELLGDRLALDLLRRGELAVLVVELLGAAAGTP